MGRSPAQVGDAVVEAVGAVQGQPAGEDGQARLVDAGRVRGGDARERGGVGLALGVRVGHVVGLAPGAAEGHEAAGAEAAAEGGVGVVDLGRQSIRLLPQVGSRTGLDSPRRR